VCFRAVRVLLKFGADPNLPDEFSNVFLVAREKGLNSLQGTAIPFHTASRVIQYFKMPHAKNICSSWSEDCATCELHSSSILTTGCS